MPPEPAWEPRALLGPHPLRELGPAWQLLVLRVGLTKLIVGGAAAVLVLSTLLLPGGEHADPFEGPGGALDLFLKLGAVLALAYVSLAALRRYTGGASSQRGTLLEVLDSTSLGPNRAVYVVRAGGRRLVLGVTQQQITALGDLDGEPLDDTASASAPGAAQVPAGVSGAPVDAPSAPNGAPAGGTGAPAVVPGVPSGTQGITGR
jgi:flagellar protein FliO/FliZ